MRLHPAIRVISLLIFAVLVIIGGWRELLLALAALFLCYALLPGVRWHVAVPLLRRIRLLVLSIALVYLWFTPGEPLWDVALAWMPSVEGVLAGAHRVLCLVALVLAVSLLLQTTPVDMLVGALLWLFHPLGRAGFPHERLAVRIALTLEAVSEIEAMYRQRFERKERVMERIRQMGAALIEMFDEVTLHAESLPERWISVPLLQAPAWTQWLFPLAMTGVFYLI